MLEKLVEIARKDMGSKKSKVTSLPSEIQERIKEFKGEPVVEEKEIEQSLMAKPNEEEVLSLLAKK